MAGTMSHISLNEIKQYILENAQAMAVHANEQTFAAVDSYKTQKISKKESQDTTQQLIEFVAKGLLRDENEENRSEDSFVEDMVSFEDGIASRRVEYKIDLIDLIIGVIIVRKVMWEWLRTFLTKNETDFFEIERKLNTIIDQFIIEVTRKYLAVRDKLIKSQSDSLKKWEEVVKSTSHLDLKIPCREEFVTIARAQAEAIARRLNFTDEDVDDLVLTIGEACDNSIEHGCSEKGVDIHYSISPQQLMVEIVDYGRGFDPEGKGEDVPDLMAERGRGIYIMKTLSDSVNIQSTLGKGSKVTIKKQRVKL